MRASERAGKKNENQQVSTRHKFDMWGKTKQIFVYEKSRMRGEQRGRAKEKRQIKTNKNPFTTYDPRHHNRPNPDSFKCSSCELLSRHRAEEKHLKFRPPSRSFSALYWCLSDSLMEHWFRAERGRWKHSMALFIAANLKQLWNQFLFVFTLDGSHVFCEKDAGDWFKEAIGKLLKRFAGVMMCEWMMRRLGEEFTASGWGCVKRAV